MQQFLKNSTIFILFSIAAYIVLLVFWGLFAPISLQKNLNYKVSGGFLDKKLNEIELYSEIDILFVGSSHAYRGFDVRMYQQAGYKVFNLGSSSQTPEQTHYLLKKYFKRLNPKLVIFEVYPEVFELDGIESGLDIVSNQKSDFDLLKMAISLNHIKIYNTLIFSSFCQLAGVTINRESKEDTYIKGGFVEKQMSLFQEEKEFLPKEWKMNKNQQDAFEKSLELIKNNHSNILLVQAPVAKVLYHSIQNNKEMDAYFSQKATYVNFNKDSKLEDVLHFYDEHHLNQFGVQLFNKELIQYLQNPQ